MRRKLFMKFKLLTTLVLLITILLTGCNSTEKKAEIESKPQSQQAISTPADKTSQAPPKTEEIFDSKKYAGKFTVRFFHVDEKTSDSWDSMLIQTPDGVNMLIDAGLPQMGPKIAEYLKKLNIAKIDIAVATHLHVDHIGGYQDILNSVPVSKLLMPNFRDYNTATAKNFLSTVDSKNIPIQYAREGDEFKLGKDVKVEILNPEFDITVPEGVTPEKGAYFLNDRSVVLKMTYGEKTFLFAADLYRDREFDLVAKKKDMLDVDVLKAPHHGADTSSAFDFINAVSPKITFVTSILPNKSVYDRYRKAGSEVYATGLDGNLLLVCDGKSINVIQEHERKVKNLYN
jgi:competence protein ComEC